MLKPIAVTDLQFNPFTLIDKEWLLITAGNRERCNTMTASWGGLGILWNKPVATCYIRPQRYTKSFVDNEEYFTLSVLAEDYRQALIACGRTSGRDVDKFAANGLTPAFAACDAPYVAEARLVLVCKKLYAQPMDAQFLTVPELAQKVYPTNDWHTMYIGEIVEAYAAE